MPLAKWSAACSTSTIRAAPGSSPVPCSAGSPARVPRTRSSHHNCRRELRNRDAGCVRHARANFGLGMPVREPPLAVYEMVRRLQVRIFGTQLLLLDIDGLYAVAAPDNQIDKRSGLS